MLNFAPVSPDQTAQLNEILLPLRDPSCEYSPANLYIWGPQQVALENGFLYVLTRHSGAWGYLFPAGCGDCTLAVQRLARDAQKRKNPLTMYAVSDAAKEKLEAAFENTFGFYEVRRGADYLYDINRLADLSGKKLQAKRNHIHHFRDACPDCEVVPISRETLNDCRQMLDAWYEEHLSAHPEGDFTAEKRALSRAFEHYDALGFEGLSLVSQGRMIAITMGTRIRTNVFDVHFEKALSSIPGAYAAINQTFAQHLRTKYPQLTLLNREDDMGIDGLRKAKLSYYPDELLRKWVAIAEPSQVLCAGSDIK